MRLAPLYEQDLEQATQEGIQQGQRRVVENILSFRYGTIDEQLSAIIERLLALPPEEFASILMHLSNLSRQELLARLGEQN